jgi:glutaconate CoA-transferase, subunit A
MIDKRFTMAEAVRLVRPGQTLALGGLTLYRRPLAYVRALIAQDKPPDKLTLLALTCGIESDMLVGAGLVSRTRTCYFGLEGFGLAPMFTQAAGGAQVEIVEESEASIAFGLRARLAGVGFMPSRAWQGTDMFSVRPDVKTLTDPYTGATVTAFPSIGCDVAVIHTLKADAFGNAVLGGNPTIDLELSTVADKVILTTEELVDELAGPIDLTGLPVTAVVSAPHGAWPTSCYPLYPIDGQELLAYIGACSAGQFEQYIARALALGPMGSGTL